MTVSAQKPRDPSLDLARGLAVLLMIQTHAFHGWVQSSLQADAVFRATRWLGAFPLPAFLLLAGVAVALRVQRSLHVGEPARQVRGELLRRGVSVVGAAYAVNLGWGAIDGARSMAAFLRADVLHAIGLSLCGVALLVSAQPDGRVCVRRFSQRATACALLITVVSPWLTRWTRDMTGSWRFLIAPFSEVRELTRMPLFPLGAWCALGVVVGLWLMAAGDARDRSRREARIGAAGVLCVLLGAWMTHVFTAALHEPLSRASVALWPNVIEGAGRGLCVLALGAWLTRWFARGAQAVLAGFGASSLVIYAVHVPLCYGRLAGPLRGALTMTQALPWVLLLMLGSYGLVLARARLRSRRPMSQATWGRT